VEKLLLFVEIHQLKKQGFKIAAIAKKLGICRNTVYKYLDMNFNEASEWVFSTESRTKKLKRIKESDLVIIDDLMYMAMDSRELMGDQGITTAILNRLLHRVEVIQLNENDSYRIKHRTTIFGEESVQD
jgi:DNA replication protein DnaC